MDKASENPVPLRTKDEGGRIIEASAAEARERIGRIEKAASGPAAEAQEAARAIEERSAEREIAENDIRQKRGDSETIESARLAAKRKGSQKLSVDRDEAQETAAFGRARIDADDEAGQDDLTRGHYGAEASVGKK